MARLLFLKFTVSVTIFSLVFSPTSIIFAQESEQSLSPPTSSVLSTDTGETISTESTAIFEEIFSEPASFIPEENEVETETESPAINSSEETQESIMEEISSEEQQGEGEGEMQSMSFFGGSDSENSFPNGLTYQTTAPKVDKATGALTEKINLPIPPGRNGMNPNISLSYNNQNAEDGIVGYGWSLDIPYIERFNRTGSERLYTDGYFTSSLGGELATTSTPGEYRHKTEDGRFIKYTFSNDIWTAYDKSGNRYLFGTTTQARQYATSTEIYKWMIEEIRDPNDNFIRFSYQKDSNQIYPYQIFYTGHNITDGIFTVEFTRSSRPDSLVSYKTGFKVTTGYRITEVKASISGQWVSKYTLAYTAGHNGYRSLLNTITQTGRDEFSNELALPPITFDYSSTTVSFTATSSSIVPSVKNIAHVPADVNGDGLQDLPIFYIENSSSNLKTYLRTNAFPNTMSSETISPASERWAVDTAADAAFYPQETGTRFFDVNGDGLSDLIRGHRLSSSTTTRIVYLNDYFASSTGPHWIGTTTIGTVPMFAYTTDGGAYNFATGILGNINGDTLTDYLMALPNQSGNQDTNGAYLGNGGGWDLTATTTFTPKFGVSTVSSPNSYNTQLIDINSDGLDDMVYSDGSQTLVCLNQGIQWEDSCSSNWTISTSTVGTNYWDRGMRFVDISNDGLVDFVHSYYVPSYSNAVGASDIEIGTKNYVLLNTGSGWATSTITSPTYITEGVLGGGMWTGDIRYSEYSDWTGDGAPDKGGYINNASRQDILKKITYPTLGTTEIEYKPSTQYAGLNLQLPTSLLTVHKVIQNDKYGIVGTTTYSYQGGKFFITNPRDKKIAGFFSITEERPNGVSKYYLHQGDSATTTIGEQTDNHGLIGKVFKEEVFESATSTIPLKRIFYRWETTDQGDGKFFVYLSKKMEQTFGASSTHKDFSIEYTYGTTTGDVLTTTHKGEVIGLSDGTYTDTGSDTSTTTITYVGNEENNLRVPTQETTVNNSSTKIKEVLNYYDNLSFASTTKGNKTREEKWISGSVYASTTKTYDTRGLVTGETNPLGATTTYTYDTHNLYVATSTNPLSHDTVFIYNYVFGKTSTTTDPNGKVWVSVYDPVGRIKENKIPDPLAGTVVSQASFTYTDNIFPSRIQETRHLNSGTSTETYTYVDGFGRAIQERRESSDTYVVKDTIYGKNGLKHKESLPYFSSGSASSTATTSTSMLVVYEYDGLDRVLAVENSEGRELYSHSGWTKTITDRNGENKDFIYDAFQNLSQVVEYNTPESYTTTYTYDLLGNLTRITDSAGNLRNFTYDGLSRLTSSEDLHASGDGTYGTYTYTYNHAGNILSQLDPKTQTIEWTYDTLNRVLTENYTGGSGVEIQYEYDTCLNGKGRLCIATSTDVVITYSYNPLGNISSEIKKIHNVNYTTAYTYDRKGNIADITYPDNSIVAYGYDSAGDLETVIRKKADSAVYVNAIREINYAPTGAVRYKQFGNGVESTYTYDANELYRLRNINTTASSTWSLGGSLGFTSPSQYFALGKAPTEHFAQKVFGETDNFVAATTSPQIFIEESNISSTDLFPGKSFQEKANLKGEELAQVGPLPPENRGTYTIEIISTEVIEGGVIAFVKAWKSNGEQIGFGNDGSVEIERFRIFNPPILVASPDGDIVQELTDKELGVYGVRKLKRDPKEALLQVIEHSLSVMKNKHDGKKIVPGKIGRTTSSFYPAAGGNTPVDGKATAASTINGGSLSSPNWSTIRNATGDNIAGDGYDYTGATHNMAQIYDGASGSQWDGMTRSIFGFDTSSLGTDTISSATFSIYGTVATDGYSGADVVLDTNTPVNTNSITYGDYNIGNWDGVEQGSNRIDISSWSTSSYNNWTLNSTGRDNINKTGNSWYGLRHSFDFDNAEPSQVNTNSRVIGYFADQSGTTNDPVLVVEHTVLSADPGTLQDATYTYDAVGNITGITDVSDTGTNKIIAFTYDPLHRLTSASTTFATSTSFKEEYFYNSIGNMTDKATGTLPFTSLRNTHSTDLERDSTQYWGIADASQTGLDFSDALTFSTWFKLESLPSTTSGASEYYFIGKWNESGNNLSYRLLYQSSNSLSRFAFSTSHNGSSVNNLIVDQSISAGTWYHIAAVKTGTTAELFLNGTSIGSTTLASATVYNGTAEFDIGTAVSMGSPLPPTTDGLIDDVRVWARALSSSDISTLYASSSTFSNGSNLSGWWPFNENGTDSSSNGNTLTSQNGPTFSTVVPFIGATTTANPTHLYSGTGYTNPHAPTSYFNGLSTTTYAYDNNGNLTSASTTTYTWDYRDRLVSVENGVATTTFGYDHITENIWKKVNSQATTTYVNKYFEIQGATSTAYIYLPDGSLVAMIIGNGEATSTSYAHTDHLGGINILTNASGTVVQTLDYYPYGTKRIDSGTSATDRQYIGERFDESTNLSYLNARYLDSQRGQFLSQDPMFWSQKMNLQNPQSLNSYSYAEGNPINKKDPTGLASYIWANGAGMTGIDTWNKGTYYQSADNAMLQTNAAIMQAAQPGSSIGGLALFTYNVWPGSVWDFKAGANAQGGNRGFYFFGDQLVPAEVYGNLHYGYVGAAGGLSSFELRGGAGLAHVMTALFGPSRIGPMSSYFDDPRDQASIQQGINTYNSTLTSSMSGFSSSNIQTRVSSVNSFNSASGAASNENKLWTTPNGAVITWGGSVVSPGVNSK